MENRQKKERKFWDRFARFYDSFINVAVDKTYQTVMSNIGSELDITKSVLEIGTGTGVIPFSICSKVSSIVATDISPEMIRIAKLKQKKPDAGNVDFQVQDCYNLTFPDKSFDVVIASNLLHLLYEPNKPIMEVKRVLKDDGIFIVSQYCVGQKLSSKIFATIGGFVSGFKIVNKWTINDFKNMLTDNGLTIDKVEIFDGKLTLAYIVMKK